MFKGGVRGSIFSGALITLSHLIRECKYFVGSFHALFIPVISLWLIPPKLDTRSLCHHHIYNIFDNNHLAYGLTFNEGYDFGVSKNGLLNLRMIKLCYK